MEEIHRVYGLNENKIRKWFPADLGECFCSCECLDKYVNFQCRLNGIEVLQHFSIDDSIIYLFGTTSENRNLTKGEKFVSDKPIVVYREYDNQTLSFRITFDSITQASRRSPRPCLVCGANSFRYYAIHCVEIFTNYRYLGLTGEKVLKWFPLDANDMFCSDEHANNYMLACSKFYGFECEEHFPLICVKVKRERLSRTFNCGYRVVCINDVININKKREAHRNISHYITDS